MADEDDAPAAPAAEVDDQALALARQLVESGITDLNQLTFRRAGDTANPPGLRAMGRRNARLTLGAEVRPSGKFTPETRAIFLAMLAQTGRLGDSAKAAGMSGSCIRDHRAGGAAQDLVFEEEIQEALATYRETLQAEVHRRGVLGWVERGIFDKEGTQVGEVVRYSDALLLAELKKHDPSYRDKVSIEANGQVLHAHASVDMAKLLVRLDKEGRNALRALMQMLPEQLPMQAAPDVQDVHPVQPEPDDA